MANAKGYIEHRIKDIEESIKRAESEFEHLVNCSNRSYDGIIQKALHIKDLQSEKKGWISALDAMAGFDEE